MRRKRTLSFHSKEEMLEQEAVEDVEYYLKEEEFYDEISHEKSYKLNFLSKETTENEDEEALEKQIYQMNQCYKQNTVLIKTKLTNCKEIICSCIKEILYEGKSIMKPTRSRSFSINSLDDIKFKTLIDSYLKESHYFRTSMESTLSTSTTSSTQESMREILNQNLMPEEELRLLIVSNSTIIKNKSLTSFLEEEIADDFIVKGLEIRKKNAMIDNKAIKITLFDTEKNFFEEQTSNIYLNNVNAVIILLDPSNRKNAALYLKNIITQVRKTPNGKQIIVIEHNSLSFKQNCIENNLMYISIQSVFDFELKYSKIMSLIKILLIKKKQSSSFQKTNENIEKDEEEDINSIERLNYESSYILKKKISKQLLNYKKMTRKWTLNIF